ncbi:acyl-CoA dehydrogenase [Mollicutes bacterium LVI A0039]|nr:acyl-CoA dehydrogenase [Mollicutes bacterium LVI A0039]
MKKKTVLLNPATETFENYDKKTQQVFKDMVHFFEHKGLNKIRVDNKNRIWQDDFIKYQRDHNIYSTLLTAEGYGDSDSRFDLHRLTTASEILAFYSESYQYPLQVSILGIGPIWMSDNEEQKKELAAQLKEGHVFAFGMSEKAPGADLYSMTSNIRPTSEGYVANGNKYYIGNAHIAPKVSTLGKNAETGEWAYWVVDSRHPNYRYDKEIETPSISMARVGEYSMIEYPLTEKDILTTGDKAFADGLATVNIGKFQLGFAASGIATHAFYEAITHSNNRVLYGRKVTDFPHIKQFLSESFARTNAMKLYSLRSRDYFRMMSSDDRRYLLFNPIQKMKVTTEGGDVVRKLMDVVCAKGYEVDTYLSDAYGTADYLFRLEGTAHVNMGLVIKFMQNYFYNNIDYPKYGIVDDIKDDKNIFDQRLGGFSKVQFPNYLDSFDGYDSENIKRFIAITELFKEFITKCPPTEAQAKNMDYMLHIGEIFTSIVYAQLIVEGAELNDVDDLLVDQIIKYFILDINKYALTQLNTQDCSEEGRAILGKIAQSGPEVNKEIDEYFWKEFVQVNDGAYVMNEAVIGSDFKSDLT